MLADPPSPHSFGGNLAVAATLSEGFRRLVTSPPRLLGSCWWDNRSDQNRKASRQTVVPSNFRSHFGTHRALTRNLPPSVGLRSFPFLRSVCFCRLSPQV